MRILVSMWLALSPLITVYANSESGTLKFMQGCWHRAKSKAAAEKIDLKSKSFTVFAMVRDKLVFDSFPRVSERQCAFMPNNQAELLKPKKVKMQDVMGETWVVSFNKIDANTFSLTSADGKVVYYFRYKDSAKNLAE